MSIDWHFIGQKFATAYYTDPIMHVASLVVVIAYVSQRKRTISMLYLTIIALASLIQSYIVLLNNSPDLTFSLNLAQSSIYAYLIIEITCCLLFITVYLHSSKTKIALRALNIVFVAHAISYWSFFRTDNKAYPLHITITEGVFIMLGALSFFYEVLHKRARQRITPLPFWAISGMLLMFSTTIPFYLALNYLRTHEPALVWKLFAINNICYALLFISFSLAITLSKEERLSIHESRTEI